MARRAGMLAPTESFLMTQTQQRPAWWNTVEQHAATNGVDSDVLFRMGGVESRFQNVDTQIKGPNGKPSSSATGPFQITKGTFEGLAQRYPNLGLSDRRDPEQQAKAAPYYLREVKDYIKSKTGREPNAGEQYLGWFLGPKDAARVLNADPSTPITQVVDARSIVANGPVFKNVATAGDLAGWSARKMKSEVGPAGTQKYGQGEQFAQNPLTFAGEGQQLPTPLTNTERFATDNSNEETDLVTGAWDAMNSENTLGYLFDDHGAQRPDPNFRLTQDFLKLHAADVPEQYLPWLADSFSEENFHNRKQRLMDDIERNQRLDSMGLTGTALRVGAAVVDPAGWLAAGALAPVGGALKLGRLGNIAVGAVEGAAGNMLAEVPMAALKPTWERDQLLYAGAGGLVFGSVFGAFAKTNPAIDKEVLQAQASARSLMQRLEGDYAPAGSSVGAAQNIVMDPVRGDVSEYLRKEFGDLYGEGAFSGLRWDATGRLKASENPLVRALGNLLGEETVGQADAGKATFRAITEDQIMIHRRMDTVWSRSYLSAWNDYRQRQGLGWTAGMNGQELEFRRQITAAMRNTDPLAEFDPAVIQMRDTWRKLNTAYLQLAKGDHRALDGSMRAPLRGFADVDANDPYVPRLVHWERFRNVHLEVGTRGLERLVTGAVRALNPDLDDAIAEKIGRGYVKRLHSVSAGQELSAQRVFSSLDVEEMRSHLRDAGLLDDEVERALYRATARDESKAGVSRGKPRQLLDENFSMALEVKGGGTRSVSIVDLFHDDAMHLFSSYNRQMSGVVAMSRLRVENPNWRAGEEDLHPRYLVEGIHSRGDWETLMAKVRAVAADEGATEKARLGVETDVTRLQFLYDAITGTPSAFDRTKTAAALRMVRDYNFIRVMNQVGFAQLADIGVVIGQLGLRSALSSMPALRSFIRDARTGRLLDDDADMLEWITTGGTDTLRGLGHVTVDDFGQPVTAARRGAGMVAAEGLLQRGSRVTSLISGMAPVNAYLQRWAAKGALHKFTDMSREGVKVNRKRLRVLGLSDDMQDRIFAEIRTHMSKVDGERAKSKLKRLNLEDWDPEVRGAFEHAIFRWTRKMVQENDPGQLNTMLGHALGKTLFQFRGFMLAAWTKNTLHNAYMRDWETLASIIGSMVFGGLAYASQVHLQSIGRDDREEFLQNRLGGGKLAAAAFQRAGFASIFPGLLDQGAYVAGLDPVFDTRVTGQPSQGLVQFPTAGLADGVLNGVRGVTGAAWGDEFTQQDARSLIGTMPFQNFLPMLWLSNATVQEVPAAE